jgi:hypothetical protein
MDDLERARSGRWQRREDRRVRCIDEVSSGDRRDNFDGANHFRNIVESVLGDDVSRVVRSLNKRISKVGMNGNSLETCG